MLSALESYSKGTLLEVPFVAKKYFSRYCEVMRIMVSGGSGQIGTYLTYLLVRQGLIVGNLGRAKSIKMSEDFSIEDFLIPSYESEYVLESLIKFKPDVFVNLASVSSVALCETNPTLSKSVNLDFPLSILEFIKMGVLGDCHFIQASSSEMFAGKSNQIISELSPVNPRSVYGKHKAEVHLRLNEYRDLHSVRASSVVLFNNESKLRDERFASKRIISDLVRLKLRLLESFRLGNDFVMRDWNHPSDTSQALRMIIESGRADDYVVGSGELHSIRELIEVAANFLQLDLSKIPIVKDLNLARSFENHGLVANSSRIRDWFGWIPNYTFKEIVEEMVLSELENVQ